MLHRRVFSFLFFFILVMRSSDKLVTRSVSHPHAPLRGAFSKEEWPGSSLHLVGQPWHCPFARCLDCRGQEV